MRNAFLRNYKQISLYCGLRSFNFTVCIRSCSSMHTITPRVTYTTRRTRNPRTPLGSNFSRDYKGRVGSSQLADWAGGVTAGATTSLETRGLYFLRGFLQTNNFIQMISYKQMKLFVEDSPIGHSRALKIRLAAELAGVKLDLCSLKNPSEKDVATTTFKKLPYLQTSEGTLSHSGAIIRHLARVGNACLLGQGPYAQSKVDELVDSITNDLGCLVAAYQYLEHSTEYKADKNKLRADLKKVLCCLEGAAAKKFLVGDKPTIADVVLASTLASAFKCAHVDFDFNKQSPKVACWILNISKQTGFAAVLGKVQLPAVKEAAPKAGKKEAAPKADKKQAAPEAKAAADDDLDLFGESTEPVVKKEKPKPKVEAKKKKQVIAKSILFFDVKVYQQETDLNELAKKIYEEVNQDGLVWSKEHKLMPVAYGMNMLRMTCVIEDEKVLTDDIFEKILAWEDLVQSVDTFSMQKL